MGGEHPQGTVYSLDFCAAITSQLWAKLHERLFMLVLVTQNPPMISFLIGDGADLKNGPEGGVTDSLNLSVALDHVARNPTFPEVTYGHLSRAIYNLCVRHNLKLLQQIRLDFETFATSPDQITSIVDMIAVPSQ